MLLIKQYHHNTDQYSEYTNGVEFAINCDDPKIAIRTMLNLSYKEEDGIEFVKDNLYYNGELVFARGDTTAIIGDYSYILIDTMDYTTIQQFGELDLNRTVWKIDADYYLVHGNSVSILPK